MRCLVRKFQKLRQFYTQAADIGEPIDCAQTPKNIIDVNHWEKVANKTANINVQNRSLWAS